MAYQKKWYRSKTIWVNAIALGALFAAEVFGVTISENFQVLALGGVNMLLRLITKEEIVWK